MRTDMMGRYIDRVFRNLIPLSVEKFNIKKAIAEWRWVGSPIDMGEAIFECGLCDQKHLRWYHPIFNKLNGNHLDVGSVCITHFGIEVYVDGQKVEPEDVARKLKNAEDRLKTKIRNADKEKKDILTSAQDIHGFSEAQLSSFIKRLDDFKSQQPEISKFSPRFTQLSEEVCEAISRDIAETSARHAKQKAQLEALAARRDRVLEALNDLDEVEDKFDVCKWIKIYRRNASFSPSHLNLIFWRFDQHGISYRKTDFNVEFDAYQILDMEDWKYRKIRPSLSASDRYEADMLRKQPSRIKQFALLGHDEG